MVTCPPPHPSTDESHVEGGPYITVTSCPASHREGPGITVLPGSSKSGIATGLPLCPSNQVRRRRGDVTPGQFEEVLRATCRWTRGLPFANRPGKSWCHHWPPRPRTLNLRKSRMPRQRLTRSVRGQHNRLGARGRGAARGDASGRGLYERGPRPEGMSRWGLRIPLRSVSSANMA